ncbi:hypothetical protein SGLAM104S_05883 [Streptomyces glaucescens]
MDGQGQWVEDSGRRAEGRGRCRPPGAAPGSGVRLPGAVAELARWVADVDAVEYGGTALWEAVLAGRADNARALADAGADPWRPLIGGWSPGRLALAGPGPELFALPEGEPGLTDAERATAEEGRRLLDALGSFHYEGIGLACVAGIDAREAVRRAGGGPGG